MEGKLAGYGILFLACTYAFSDGLLDGLVFGLIYNALAREKKVL